MMFPIAETRGLEGQSSRRGNPTIISWIAPFQLQLTCSIKDLRSPLEASSVFYSINIFLDIVTDQ